MRKRRSLVIAALLFVILTFPAIAQVQNGEFVGLVTDATGAVIPGALINVQNSETGLQIETRTDKAGFYSARALPIGLYRVSVEAKGFPGSVRAIWWPLRGAAIGLQKQKGYWARRSGDVGEI